MSTSKKSETKAPAGKTAAGKTEKAAKSKSATATKTVATKPAGAAKPVKPPPQALKPTLVTTKPVSGKPPKLAVVASSSPAAKKTAAKAAAGAKAQPKATKPAPQSKVRIFQIYYEPTQRPQLDPALIPYNNEGELNPLVEFNVFRKLMQSELVQGAELWGALSWKFTEKTGITGAQLHQVITDNPGRDVYFCNPYPELEALYHNLWLQGETAHPNFLLLCREFFEAAGLDVELLKAYDHSSYFAAANYFVASPRFWRAYLEFTANAILKADAGMSKTAKAMMYSNAADRIGLHAGASYLPFIVERLFSVFLKLSGKTFSAYKFALPAKEEGLNVHLKLLRQMKDLSIKTKSLWMATCWVNYRNLYMGNHFGAAWCKKHLQNITPTEFKYLK